jgi:hypothetical protein
VSCSERNLRTGSLSQACEMKMIKQLLYRFHSLFVETEGCNGNAEYSLIASNTSKILFCGMLNVSGTYWVFRTLGTADEIDPYLFRRRTSIAH